MLKYFYLKTVYTLYYLAVLIVRRWNTDRKKNSLISQKFINWNNKRVMKYVYKNNVKSREIAILLPHCLQLYTCPHKITSDIKNCKNCGLCKIGEILRLHNTYDVKVKVYKEIAHFFEQKDFLQSQEIEEKFEDGSLIINFEISHDEDIDNIIKSWLPHIEILEPIRFRDKLKNELKEYLYKID